MSRTTALDALAAATAAMVSPHHQTDVLTRLVDDCVDVLQARSAAILVSDVAGAGLALLNASSHQAAEVELLQAQSERGPCVDAIAQGSVVSVHGAEALVERWDDVGQAMVSVGYLGVQAFPMRWYGRVVGGLNVFRERGEEPAAELGVAGQALADVATLVLVQSGDVPADQLAARVHDGVRSRAVVEQAKGVLAYLHAVDVDRAYDLLVQEAGRDGGSVTEAALRIVRAQVR